MENLSYQTPNELRQTLVDRLRKVEEELRQLSREAETLRSDLELTDSFLSVWRRANNLHGPDWSAARQFEIESDVPMPRSRAKNPSREAVVSASLQLISAAGRPMTRAELFQELKERGLEVFGKDPQMVLSTMLWRSQDQIVRLPGHGYWPKHTKYLLANYEPILDDLIGVAAREPEGELEDPDEEVVAGGH